MYIIVNGIKAVRGMRCKPYKNGCFRGQIPSESELFLKQWNLLKFNPYPRPPGFKPQFLYL